MEKSRNRWWLLVVPAMLAVVGLGFARAYASGPFRAGRGHAPQSAQELRTRLDDKLERLLDAVDATDQQRAHADALSGRLTPELYAIMDEGRALRGELKTLLLAEQLDKARIAETEAKLAALADRLVHASMDGLSSVADILTPAQRRKVADKLARLHL